MVAKGNLDVGHVDEFGNYSGIIGILQRHEADSGFIPTTIDSLAFDPVLVGATLLPAEAMLATVKHNDSMKEADVLGYFQSVPTIAYLYFFITYYVIAVIFAFRGVRRVGRTYRRAPESIRKSLVRVSKGMWYVYSAIIEQNFPNPRKISVKVLWGSVMIFTFISTQLVFGAMNVDMIVPIKGKNVETLQDLQDKSHAHMVPIIFKNMPLYKTFKDAKTSPYKDIWKRCLQNSKKCLRDVTYYIELTNDSPLPRMFSDKLELDEVLFSTRLLQKVFHSANCYIGKNLDYYHQGTVNFRESIYVMLHSKKIDRNMRSKIDRRSWKMFQSGLYWAFIKEAMKAGSPVPYTYSIMRCEEGIAEIEDKFPEGITNKNTKRVFFILISGLFISLLIFMFAIIPKKVKRKLKVRKNMKLFKALRSRARVSESTVKKYKSSVPEMVFIT